MDEIRTRLREMVEDLLEQEGHSRKVSDDESLIQSGHLDSLAVIQLVVFMEKEFDIDFSALYFDQGIFDTIRSMEEFVRSNCPRPLYS